MDRLQMETESLFFNNLTVKLTSEHIKVIGVIKFEYQSYYNFFLWLCE